MLRLHRNQRTSDAVRATADPFGCLRASSSGFSSLTWFAVRVAVVSYQVAGSMRETRTVWHSTSISDMLRQVHLNLSPALFNCKVGIFSIIRGRGMALRLPAGATARVRPYKLRRYRFFVARGWFPGGIVTVLRPGSGPFPIRGSELERDLRGGMGVF